LIYKFPGHRGRRSGNEGKRKEERGIRIEVRGRRSEFRRSEVKKVRKSEGLRSVRTTHRWIKRAGKRKEEDRERRAKDRGQWAPVKYTSCWSNG